MSTTTEYTYEEVKAHETKKDLWVVLHDKVYDITKFVDEHPGGEEVLLDVAGQEATDSFEDVGHSDEAREILDALLIGKLKIMEGDKKPRSTKPVSANSTANTSSTDSGAALYAFLVVAAGVAFGAYKYLQVNAA